MSEGEKGNREPLVEANLDGWKNGKKRQIRRRLYSRQMSVLTLVIVGFTLWNVLYVDYWTVNGQALTPEQVKQVREFIEKHNAPDYTNFSYDQLQQWFENQTPEHLKFEEYPRLYPFCVTHDLINDPQRTNEDDHIFKFKEIFFSMESVNERFYNFNVTKHSTLYNKNWVKNIRLSRINTPEMDMVNLRQWVHVEIEAPEPIQGLYIQSIVGPMGLPFGEFYLDFPCQDKLNETADMKVVGQLSYCSYRPRTTIQHPSVYVGYDQMKRTKFHMNFFWTDLTCMETPYLQFLMVVVKDFDFNATVKGKAKLDQQYKPLLSPIYLNTDFDSKSGAPFPYYPEWREQMYCYLNKDTFDPLYTKLYPGVNDPKDTLNPNRSQWPSKKRGVDTYFSDINWVEDQNTFRIQPNEAYDSCLTANKNNPAHANRKFHLRDEERLECPPGPFRCDASYGGDKRHEVLAARQELVKKENEVSKCVPCGAPQCIDIGFPDYKCDFEADEITINVNESTSLNVVETITTGKSHGLQAMLAFLVIIPIANFIARFYKEMCGHFMCDNGPWIFIHILAHIASLVFMWVAVGPVIPKLSEYETEEKRCAALHMNSTSDRVACVLKSSIQSPHNLLGLLAFFMQHCLILCGFWHSKNNKIRGIQVIMHSHFGYLCWITGALAAIMGSFDNDCKDILTMSIFLFLVPLIFSSVAVALDCLNDKKIGVIPPRKQWPILEGIKLEGRSPLGIPKLIVLGAFIGIMVLVWLMSLGTAIQTLGSTSELFNSDKNKNPRLSSLFGECSGTATYSDQGSKTYSSSKRGE